MARNSARPGRTVAVFFIVLAIAYGLVALVGTWKPALGLDLEGGTQITLIADGSVSKDNLNQAADIIDARVNGSGVSEAEVTTQGSNEIVVQVPGSTQSSLVETVIRAGSAPLPAGGAGAADDTAVPPLDGAVAQRADPSFAERDQVGQAEGQVHRQEPHAGAAREVQARNQEGRQEQEQAELVADDHTDARTCPPPRRR